MTTDRVGLLELAARIQPSWQLIEVLRVGDGLDSGIAYVRNLAEAEASARILIAEQLLKATEDGGQS